MSMFHMPLPDVDFHHVEEFCRTWPEGVRVEYKQEITQVPKIVSSFANTRCSSFLFLTCRAGRW
jgi:hypothetical protein